MYLNKKQKLLDAGIEAVAELGFEKFSMAKVAKKADTSERLLYQHFTTKQNFLYECFKEIIGKIEEMYADGRFEDVDIFKLDNECKKEAIKENWLRYFEFLISHRDDTLFFYEYMMSDHASDLPITREHMNRLFFRPFLVNICGGKEFVLEGGTIEGNIGIMFAIDSTISSARRILLGEIPDTEMNRERIFELLYGGMKGFIE